MIRFCITLDTNAPSSLIFKSYLVVVVADVGVVAVANVLIYRGRVEIANIGRHGRLICCVVPVRYIVAIIQLVTSVVGGRILIAIASHHHWHRLLSLIHISQGIVR